MKKIKVEFKEVLSRVVEIEADTEEEALEKANEMYDSEEVVLDPEDFEGHEIEIYQEKE